MVADRHIARRGRPPTGEKAKRSVIAVRATPEFRAKIDAAARASGRSMSQEIEFRLEQSFDEDRVWAIVRFEVQDALERAKIQERRDRRSAGRLVVDALATDD